MPSNCQRIGHAILAFGLLSQALPLPAGNTCCRRSAGQPGNYRGSASEKAYLRSFLLADYLTWRQTTLQARLLQAGNLPGESLLRLWGGLTETDYQAALEREIAANQRQLDAPEQPVDYGAMTHYAVATGRLEAALERLLKGSQPAVKGSPKEEARESAAPAYPAGDRKASGKNRSRSTR